jgi:DNA-binding NtrC family response regulator
MKTVLLLEDDTISLALYKRVLGREYSLVEAATPNDALHAVGTVPVDLVIADNLLRASESGVSVLNRVHQIKPELRLLLVSGTPVEGFLEDDFNQFKRLAESTVFDFLQKPFTSEALVRTATIMMSDKWTPYGQNTRPRFGAAPLPC